MRHVLDTGVLWRKEVVARLGEMDEEVILPAVAYAERARQYRARGWPVEDLDALLDQTAVTVEAMDGMMARRWTERLVDKDQWRRLGFDALIAGHIRDGDRLWTTNPQDFEAVGVPSAQIVAC